MHCSAAFIASLALPGFGAIDSRQAQFARAAGQIDGHQFWTISLDSRRDSSEMKLVGGTKLLNKVTACKVNSSSGAEQPVCLYGGQISS